MASPDASPYIDLRLLDVTTQELFESSLENLLSYLPEWVPREGHTEVLLLESLAIAVTEGVFAINRLPGALVEALLVLYGIARDLGSPPSGQFTFTVADTSGHVIPAETRIALPVDLSSGDVLVFATVEPLLVPAGQLTATALAVADTNTVVANGTAPGAYVELIDSVAVVERVELTGFIGGGAPVEDDFAWFSRGMQRFSRLSETLVLPRHFTAAALEFPFVERAFTIDNTAPAGTVGAAPGHVSVAVYGDGAPVSADNKALLLGALDSSAQANLAVHIIDPTITLVEVEADVVVRAGFTPAAAVAAVADAVRAYLSPALWGWGATVYYNEVISLIDQVPAVERVDTMSLNGTNGNITLSGVAPLAQASVPAINPVT